MDKLTSFQRKGCRSFWPLSYDLDKSAPKHRHTLAVRCFHRNTHWHGWIIVNALRLWWHGVSRFHLDNESFVDSTVWALGRVDRRLSGKHCRSWRGKHPCQQGGLDPTFLSPSFRIRCCFVHFLWLSRGRLFLVSARGILRYDTPTSCT